ncbi:MAG: beta-ketoacyl synthase, partial [Algoriella sp.]|nr:beta-ketoacyl synthase [Algoriella sp.]
MDKIYINRANIITPLGNSVESNWEQLVLGNSGISKINSFGHLKNFYAGQINDTQFRNLKEQVIDNKYYTR